MTRDIAELTTGSTVKAPPDAHRHAILQTYHRLPHIVHLISISHLTVLLQLLEELGEVIK